MMSLRKGSVDDLDASARLMIEASSARIGRPWTYDDLTGTLRKRVDEAYIIVAEDEQTIVGTIWLTRTRKRATGEVVPGVGLISMLAVAPAHWRRGIARTLMNRAIDEVRRRGEHTAFLSVEADNEGAIKLYRSLGFSPYDDPYTTDSGVKRQNYALGIQ